MERSVAPKPLGWFLIRDAAQGNGENACVVAPQIMAATTNSSGKGNFVMLPS